jgi:hypothetical protein
VSQFSEFCHHNTLCCFPNVYCCFCCLFRYRLSPEIFGYTLVFILVIIYLLIYLFIYLCIYLFIYLFIYAVIHFIFHLIDQFLKVSFLTPHPSFGTFINPQPPTAHNKLSYLRHLRSQCCMFHFTFLRYISTLYLDSAIKYRT